MVIFNSYVGVISQVMGLNKPPLRHEAPLEPPDPGGDVAWSRSCQHIETRHRNLQWWAAPASKGINHYPLVNIGKAIENGHRNSWFTQLPSYKMVIFCYLTVYQRVEKSKELLYSVWTNQKCWTMLDHVGPWPGALCFPDLMISWPRPHDT